MYPNKIITSKLYPQHLGIEWLVGYTETKNNRIKYKKLGKTDSLFKMLADSLKLSLNGGGYGKTGEKFNWQYDPLVKYSTTIQCQLDILLYVQMIYELGIPIRLESGNTDGVNIIYNKKYYDIIQKTTQEWNNITKAELERTEYKKVIRRDVNNYIAIKSNGDIKLKGIFELYKELYKDFSNQIIIIALNNYFINNKSVEETINNHNDIYDFLATIKVQGTKQGTWTLYHTYLKKGELFKIKLQKVNRYYVCKDPSSNIIKELDNNADKWSHIEAGFNVKPLNFIEDKNAFNYDINRIWYINQCKKIINEIEDKQLQIWNKS